jgi:hypothetical protein
MTKRCDCANSRTTLDIYTRAVSQQKRDANTKAVQMMLPRGQEKASAPISTYVNDYRTEGDWVSH